MLIYDRGTGQVRKTAFHKPDEREVGWIRLKSPTGEEARAVLEGLFGCHPLLVEDAVKMNQRPKLDKYERNVFITFFAIDADMRPQEMALVVGDNYVITLYREPIPILDALYEEFRQVPERMKHAGDILYHILDRCVDEYVDIMDKLESRVERFENTLHRNPYVRIAGEVYRYKRSLQRLRRIFAEERNILNMVSHPSFPYTRQESDVYFIDICDHLSRVVDSIDIFRESVSGLIELQMNMKSDRMNEVMKTLTVISSFFLPLTFIVGVYGMNFRLIPELSWKYGYLYVWGLMIVVTIALGIYYKRKKWF